MHRGNGSGIAHDLAFILSPEAMLCWLRFVKSWEPNSFIILEVCISWFGWMQFQHSLLFKILGAVFVFIQLWLSALGTHVGESWVQIIMARSVPALVGSLNACQADETGGPGWRQGCTKVLWPWFVKGREFFQMSWNGDFRHVSMWRKRALALIPTAESSDYGQK